MGGKTAKREVVADRPARALDEAVRQRTAVEEVLATMSRAPMDLQATVDAVARNAVLLCEAEDASVLIRTDHGLRPLAHFGPLTSSIAELPLERGSASGRAVLDGRTVHVPDLVAVANEFPTVALPTPKDGVRAVLSAPLLRGDQAVGVITLRRQQAVAFSERQIELLETFARQAAIAIENVRLADRTTRALDQQRAIAEILEATNRSAFEIGPVMAEIARHAASLCEAEHAWVGRFLPNGDIYLDAYAGPSDEIRAEVGTIRTSTAEMRKLDGRTINIDDVTVDPVFGGSVIARIGRWRGFLRVPLMRHGVQVGGIVLARSKPGRFTEEQVGLVQTFGEQAVVAMENVRLFNETREALERQTATSEVLKVISQASTDVTPVFQAIVERAARLCDADTASLMRRDGDAYRGAAHCIRGESSPSSRSAQEDWFVRPSAGAGPDRGTVTGRVALERRTVQIDDVQADEEYDKTQIPTESPSRTLLGVPMLHEGELIGVIVLRRREMRPFTGAQIDLIETFADQAVIAIENARSRETVERQRAEMRRFLSPQVADLITSPEGQALLAGHRREITVVFCDLRGFTAFSETADPEEALAVVRTYHATLGPLIFEHGGTLEHFEGDGAMVFFNDPVLMEDHALRAVKMTLAMRVRMAEHVTKWRKRGDDLGFGCGIATGYATLGRIGFEGRYDYGAIGPVTNLAARLGSEAKAGQILISQRAFAQLEEHLDVEPVGELSVKGYSRPQAAYNVLRVKEPIPA